MTDLNKKKILIVDDHPGNISILQRYLSMYDCESALNGETALIMIEENKPDLIILDVMMPGMNGITVAKRLKENPETSEIPIIFITAQTDIESEGFDLDDEELIKKPYYPDIVQQIVKDKLAASEKKRNS